MDSITKMLFENKELDMKSMYAEGIARGGDNTFAIYRRADGSEEDISYNEINSQSEIALTIMQNAGLKKGDRVAVIATLRPFWYSLTYACLKGGYIMVCIDPGVPTAQIQQMLLETETRIVFTTLPHVHLPKELDGHIGVYAIDRGFYHIDGPDKADVLLPDPSPVAEGTFFILFSSGTTGEKRKGVLLRSTTITEAITYNMSTDSGVYKDETNYSVHDRDLMLFPPYHIAGLLCATFDIYCNTQVIILERLTPQALVGSMQELKPDNICTVPSMLTTLKNKIVSGYSKNIFVKLIVSLLLAVSGFIRRNFGKKAGLRLLHFLNKKAFGGNMKSFMIGASPIDTQTNEFFLNMGIDVANAYGLTELGAPVTVTGKGYYPGTAGRVVRHTDKIDVRIVNKDENGRGEVEILSPYRMISYMNPEDMIGTFTDDGYFRSGDLGYFDENDCLVICGRAKEVIVSRTGENILPEEIEQKYQGVDCVNELTVFRVPGEGGSDAFCIAAVKDKARALPDESIRLRVLERASKLPPMYQPKEVYIVPELPLSSSHKVQRFRLTQMVAEGRNTPVTEAAMRKVDEDETVAKLRENLVAVGGPQWNTADLTEGTELNLDSLQSIDLFVAVGESFGIDLFQLSSLPETFGALYDAVKNFAVADKTTKSELDLSQYPKPCTPGDKLLFTGIGKLSKLIWNVHGDGIENLPEDTNYLMCCNHRTTVDPGFICSLLPRKVADRTCIVGKADLVDNKLINGFTTSHNLIPIDRTGNSVETLDRCRELLNEGWNVLIFPEGTNYENNEVMFAFKEGAARLAIATGKPIVPIHLKGVRHSKAEMSAFKLPPTGGRITISFGKPISPEGHTPKSLNEVLRAAIEAL